MVYSLWSRQKRSLTLVELLLALCVIFIFFGVFAIYANVTLRIAREQALGSELSNIRVSLEHYIIINGALPPNLITLMNNDFTLKDLDGKIIYKKFLKPFRIDKQGYLLDPFMNQYKYDMKTGRVFSGTKEYRNW